MEITSIPLEWVMRELEEKKGGACFVQSIGAQMVLQQLGFDSYVTVTHVQNRNGSQILHFVTIVQNVTQQGSDAQFYKIHVLYDSLNEQNGNV